MMLRRFVLAGLGCSLFPLTLISGDLVINEIMYHPSSADPLEEYIELYNQSPTNSVSLNGWTISRGVSFAFPPGLTIAPGEYLVVAADVAVFTSRYGAVEHLTGGWEGELSNAGEDVEIENALGEREDIVAYADSGDWGIRQRGPLDNNFRGWDWFAEHDGLGKTLELINVNASNENGQNWASSGPLDGTPGAPNSVAAANIAPLIANVGHFPAIPRSTDPVTISVEITDELATGLTVSLFYRNASGAGGTAFQQTAMFDDGAHEDGNPNDGVYAVILPAMASGTVIDFYVSASDSTGLTRTWPAAARQSDNPTDNTFAQTANALYQVDDTEYAGNQPVHRFIMTEQERGDLASNGIRQSNAEMNATFISVDGTGTKVRYNAGIRIRGAGSRGARIPNYRVNIPSDRRWNGVDALNHNAQYGHAQVAGAALSLKVDLHAANARATQVRVNGANLALVNAENGYGSYVLMEVMNGDWAENHIPQDPNGNVYSARRPNTSLQYLGTDPVSYINNGYGKNSNTSENDWSDLINLTFVLNNAANETYVEEVGAVANLREWMRYFAFFTVTSSGETSLGTGEQAGDDYNMYRGIVDPRFLVLPHDLDTILDQGQGPGDVDENIFRAANNPIIARMIQHPEIVPMYFEELLRMIEGAFSEEEIGPMLDRLLGDFVPAGTIEQMKEFARERNAYILSQIPQELTVTSGLPFVNGYARATAAAVNLNGQANAIRTRSVRVNGQLANWTAWQGNWTISGVSVRPGINRILVQSFDENGQEFERAIYEVWYDDTTVVTVSAGITADTTWTAAGGPYLIPSTITVSGATLTIQPGTTVYLGNNADLNIAATGRLLAEGTSPEPIVFTRQPGATTSWGGVNISGNAGSPETRIAYAHFNFNGDTAVHSTDGTVFLDHLTFGNTAQTYVEVDRSSFVIQDCVFPTATAEFELVHGAGGVKAGGRALFLRNFFGFTLGYNDSVDFTGGNRPGPVVQFFNNVFLGSDDDILDLDSTDSWIQGNIFLRTHRNGSPDSASAISGGADNADTSEITIIGNIFYDIDQVANAKQGNFYTLLNNTIVRQTIEGSEDEEGGVIVMADEGSEEGAGMWLEGNIIVDAEQLVRAQTDSIVTFTNNIMALEWTGPGGNNLDVDPQLNYIPELAEVTNLTSYAEAQILWEWFALREGSPARGAGPNGTDLGASIPYGVSLSGQPQGMTRDTGATIQVGINRSGGGIPNAPAAFPDGSGFTHYRWRLDGSGPWSAATPIDTPITLTGLADGEHFVEVSGRLDSGIYQDDPALGSDAVVTRTESWLVSPFLSRLVINEILARNRTAYEVDGSAPDVVELFNDSSVPMDLSGMGVTDDETNKFKYVFPAGTTLGAGEYLILQADNAAAPGFHLGFGLDATGDYLFLYSAAGTLIDSIRFGAQVVDLSIGRLADGGWGLAFPSLGGPNVAHPVNSGDRLQLNEWLAIGGSSFPDDFVEVYNPDPVPASVGGMYLTDEQIGWPDQHQVAPLTFIAGNGHLAFLAVGDTGRNSLRLNFTLAGEQGRVALLNQNLEVVDCVDYGPQRPDVSQGRRPDGSDTLAFFGAITQSQPTPGGPNPSSGISVNVSNIVVTVFPRDTEWRYENTGTDLGTEWRHGDYDDSFWLSGPALLGVENSNLPAPGLQTEFSNYNPNQTTYYFRKDFVVDEDLSEYSLRAVTVLDDAAVIYLNGNELQRIRMPQGPISFNTQGLDTVDNAATEFFELPNAMLAMGNNVLAVEVHQGAGQSSDIVWGMSLEAVRTVTNIVAIAGVLNEVMANNASFTNSDGTVTDYIEILNPLDTSVDMSGMSLTDTLDEPRRWVFPAGSVMTAGSYLTIKADSGTPATLTYGPNMNTGFGLSANGDAVFLFDTPSRGSALLDSIQFGLQTVDLPIGRFPSGTATWALNLATPGSQNLLAGLAPPNDLKINEWMADPDGGDDWFEVFNPNNQPVALGGLYLTDDLTDRTKHQIVPLSFIGAVTNGFAQFFADGNPENGADHVDFSLRAQGESIAIARDNGAIIDSVSFGPQAEGVSEGRLPDGASQLVKFEATPTPQASNYLPLTRVVVNEALTHSDPPREDAIELYNPTAESVSVGGWYLSDTASFLRKFRIPDGTVVPAEGFVVFYEYQFIPDPRFPESFALSSAEGDAIYLTESDPLGNLSGYRHIVDFGPAENGVTFGRQPTSIGFDFTAMAARTLGAEPAGSLPEFREGQGLPNSAPKVGPIVINEIMYHPPDIGGTNDNSVPEFIELYNMSPAAVALYDTARPTNTWRLRDAVDFDFPPNTSIPALGYLLVVSFDPATNAAALAEFEATYSLPGNVTLVGPYQGELNNSGEDIELKKPDPPQLDGSVPYVLVDWVDYQDSNPWPRAADSGTNLVSLQKINAGVYGNDPVHWLAGTATPGAASGPAVATRPSFTVQPVSQSLPPGGTASFNVAVNGTGPISLQWRLNGMDLPGATNTSLSVPNAQIADGGSYDVRAVNAVGAALSGAANLTLEVAPFISQDPQPKIAALGSRTFFSVAVRGTLPMSFQWRFDDGSGPVPIPDGTNQTLIVSPVENADVGSYSVVIDNAFGSATSGAATLQIADPPQIVEQPEDTAVLVGRTANFRVIASGNVPLGYQWFRNGAALSGANSATLNLPNAQLSDAGTYSVRVTNQVGVAFSDDATLTVIIPPMVSIVATAPLAREGSTPGQFTITRTGNTALALDVMFTITGTAGNGTDYQTISVPLTIPSGSASIQVPVTTIDDDIKEFAETVRITLMTTEEYNAVNPTSASVTIEDDDNISPTVAVTSPSNGLVLPITPTNVLLTATANDPDGSIARVEFFNHGSQRLAELTGPPFTYNWTDPTLGTNIITAVATDNLGRSTVSGPVTLFVNIPPVVQITRPGTGSAFPPGTNIIISAETSDADGTVELVEFFANDQLLESFTEGPYETVLEDPPLGNYALTVRVTDNLGMTTLAPVVNIRVRIPSSQFADFFVDRGEIGGFVNVVTNDNTVATMEVGEPAPYAGGTRTMWITWKAPESGQAIFQTVGSAFDTVISVYTNSPPDIQTLTNLVLMAQNDDWQNLQSLILFDAMPGIDYHIRVEGYGPVDAGYFQFIQVLQTEAPHILFPPEDQIVLQGGTAEFAASVTALNNFNSQWYFNGAPIPGANATTLTLTNVQPFNLGEYYLVVANAFGSDTSQVARLELGLLPSFVRNLMPQSVVAGDTAYMEVEVTGTPPFEFQWRRVPSTILVPFGEGTETLVLTNVQSGGLLFVEVRNRLSPGVLRSAFANLTVQPDADGDHVGDTWETDNGFDPDDPSDALLDADGDGASNHDEFRAGTDPYDPANYLRLDGIQRSGVGVTMMFEAVGTKSYSILYQDQLGPPDWITLMDINSETADRTVTVTDTNAPSVGQRFYQLTTPKQR